MIGWARSSVLIAAKWVETKLKTRGRIGRISPAAPSVEVGVEPLSEVLVLRRAADEARAHLGPAGATARAGSRSGCQAGPRHAGRRAVAGLRAARCGGQRCW